MVGNMIDIKKNTAISATTDTPSTLSITTPHSAMLISAGRQQRRRLDSPHQPC